MRKLGNFINPLTKFNAGFGRTGKLFSLNIMIWFQIFFVMGKEWEAEFSWRIYEFSRNNEITFSILLNWDTLLLLGNPLIVAASYATLKEVLESSLMNEDKKKKTVSENY